MQRLMLTLVLLLVATLLLAATTAFAQTVAGDRVRLNTGPCVITSQAGPPVRLVFTGTCDGLTNGSGNFELDPVGDLVFDPTGNDVLPFSVYDINLGSLQKKFLTLHAAELWVETLVAQNTIATIGGRVLVAPTNLLTADLGSGATSISVKYNNLASGDRVYMEADGKVEFMSIDSAPGGGGPYTYNVTRNLDGSGANEWYAGDAILNTGQTGNGFIDLYSVRGVKAGTELGPSIVGNVRNSATYNDWSPRWAVGNLDGLYGYSGSTYGAAFGNASATNVTIDATNGFRIRNSTTNKFTADTSGNLSIVGDLSVGTSGVIRSGATAFGTGTGYWLDYNSGTPRFRIGVPGGAGMEWNGSSLVVRGTGGSGTNIIVNSECLASTDGWTGSENHGLSTSILRNSDPLDLGNAGGTCYVQTIGTPAAGTLDVVASDRIPVAINSRYEASGYLGGNNGTATGIVYIAWYTTADGYISASTGTNMTFGGLCTGGYLITQFCRTGVVGTAPGTAAYARLIMQRTHDGTTVNPYMLWAHVFFGEATSTQTELSPWGPAGLTEITGGMIRTGTITASHLNVATLSAISANIGTVTAGTITGVSITTTTGTIGGFTLGSTTLTGDNLVISNTGNITVGTSNNVARMSDDGTIRFWAGHATAGSAPFQVSQTGVVTASNVNITGGTLDIDSVTIDSNGITVTDGTGSGTGYKFATSNVGIFHDSIDFEVIIRVVDDYFYFDNSAGFYTGQSVPLGTDDANRWSIVYAEAAKINGLSGTGTRHICADADGDLVVCP